MRLSVNCMTRGPAARVAAQLALLRGVADELLVAVDDRAEPDVVQALTGVADRLILFPYADPVDRPLAWLHRECAGDWVLTVDDDEVASAALIERLPDLLRDEQVTHYWLRRLWLHPDTAYFLDAPPWNSDYLLRLVRNDPRLLRFPTEPHNPIEALGPGRYLDLPLYHLDTAVNSLDQRRDKVARYDEVQPGGKRAAGLPINTAFYLPELRPAVETAPVPRRDSRVIDAVLASPPPSPRRLEVERATREQIDRAWEGATLRREDYAARIEVVGKPALVAGEPQTIDVRVTNLGTAVWPWGRSLPEIRVVTRWPQLSGAEEFRTPFPAPLGPGESQLVAASVAAPVSPGRYRLDVDLVHEHVRWFDCGCRLRVDVVPAPRLDHEPATAGASGDAVATLRERVAARLAGRRRDAMGPTPEWEYVPEGWARPVPGWDVESVVAEETRKWHEFVAAASTRDPLAFDYEARELDRSSYPAHNTILSFGYVLALAARDRDRLSLLDWGGGIGHYRVLAEQLLPDTAIDYTCKDMPRLADAGRRLHPDAEFTSDEAVLDRTFDVVLASASLQYAEDWRGLLERFARASHGYVYVARLPMALASPSHVVVQRAHAHGYATEYLGWVLNRNEFLSGAADSSLTLDREFLVSAWFDADGAPERPTGHRSFLFHPNLAVRAGGPPEAAAPSRARIGGSG